MSEAEVDVAKIPLPEDIDESDRLSDLLKQKRLAKSQFTKAKSHLTGIICSAAESTEPLKNSIDNVLRLQTEVINILLSLCDVDAERFEAELDAVQDDSKLSELLLRASDLLKVRSNVINNTSRQTSSTDQGSAEHDEIVLASPSHPPSSSNTFQIDRDMYQQLQRVSIPKFRGNKRDYPLFKDAFEQCIDKVNCSDGYKMLQLRQYLEGEALRAIEGFSATEHGYSAAKNRLEEKFGGHRRSVLLHLDSVRQMKPINFNDLKQLEEFTDKLELSIISLKDAGRVEEFEANSMYYSVAKSKLSPLNVANFKRWSALEKKTENLVHLHSWLSQEVRFRVEAQEEVDGFNVYSQSRSYPKPSNVNNHVGKPRAFSSKDIPGVPCVLCNANHKLVDCTKFRSLNVSDRWEVAKEYWLCFRCLSASHHGSNCKYTRRCNVGDCRRSHHSLLHGGGYTRYSAPTEQENSSHIRPNPYLRTPGGDKVAMRIVQVWLSNRERRLRVNALLDECSTDSYVSESIASELGLWGHESRLHVSVLGGKRVDQSRCRLVNCELTSLDGKTRFNIEASTVKNVTGDLQMIDWSKYVHNWPHLQGIDFPRVEKKTRVDLLLGLNLPDVHRALTEISGCPGEPIARLTPLGWTCIGPLCEVDPRTTSYNHLARTFFTSQDETNELLRRMWELETSGVNPDAVTPYEKQILDKSKSPLEFNGDRYIVDIPWKDSEPQLSNNFNLAQLRLRNLERSLANRPLVASEYKNIIRDHEQKDYIRLVPTTEYHGDHVWFIPHFPVVRLAKETTKVRIVMDAAARFDGKSLNDCIHAGPKLQKELLDVLIRFRNKPIALASDISEMFLQIEMKPEDRRYHRFLWRDLDATQPIKQYEYQRLVFGNTSSPYLSQLVIQEHCKSKSFEFPWGVESVLNSMYVDDLLDSVDSIDLAKTLRREITELLRQGGFHIRKWSSNELAVLSDIPQEDRVGSLEITDKSGLPTLKTLGILWIAQTDCFTFDIDEPYVDSDLTKRIVVSKTAKLFDPLNLLAPFTVRAKIGIQETWVKGLDWDAPLPRDLQNSWNKWFSELPQLRDVNISRCLINKNLKVVSKTIHTFVDASEVSYAAAVYLRSEYETGPDSVNLIAAKTRIAPLKALSIPKLELSGAVLGLRLTQTVCQVLNICTSTVTYWSDSHTVLFWIKGESRKYKPFVSHRIGEIHSLSDPCQWRYVPSKQNSSDLATRGISAAVLADCDLWWHGPNFLCQNPEFWPTAFAPEPSQEGLEEIKPKQVTSFVTQRVQRDFGRLAPSRYSSWLKLTRVTAWIYRFLRNRRTLVQHRNLSNGLSVLELAQSEKFWIYTAQCDEFHDERKSLILGQPVDCRSNLAPLNPIVDNDGIIRIDGRLRQASHLSYDSRFPVILPRNHDVTRLIVTFFHTEGGHDLGLSHTLSDLRQKYWIIRARQAIKTVEFHCAECKRRKCKSAKQVMAPLPLIRLGQPLRAFAKVGVDFAGPFITKQGRGKIQTKRYLCLFTCLASRAVHLEMDWGLDTQSFLMVFDRFVYRRGKPILVLSDNGTNFVGANRELRELYKLDTQKVGDNLASKGIEWRFNPPLAPHFGGVFESLIKSAKRAIKAILGNADIKDEDLLTAFVHVEGLLNSRPLCYQGNDHRDEPVLTQNHFLFGQVGDHSVPPHVIDDIRFNPRNRWRRIQDLVNQFWKRWIREFLPMLNNRCKWQTPHNNLCEGDMVLVIDQSNPRGKWPLGRVVKTYPGVDNKVRVVDVRIGDFCYQETNSSFVSFGGIILKPQ